MNPIAKEMDDINNNYRDELNILRNMLLNLML